MRSIKPVFRSDGFTILELLIVIAIIVILAAVGADNYYGFRKARVLDSAVSGAVTTLRETMERSKSQADGSQWGVHFANPSGNANDFYEVWKGASYTSGTVISKMPLDTSLKFTDPPDNSSKDIIFSKATGLPTVNDTIVIQPLPGPGVGTITVDISGRIDFILN